MYSWKPRGIYIREVTEAMILAAIGELTKAQQRRLKLYYYDGIRYSQIVKMEDVTDGSISNSVKSALKQLGKQKKMVY